MGAKTLDRRLSNVFGGSKKHRNVVEVKEAVARILVQSNKLNQLQKMKHLDSRLCVCVAETIYHVSVSFTQKCL